MKAYVAITGLLFGLMTLAHAVRVFLEGAHLFRHPLFSAFTLAAAVLSLWAAWLLLRPASR
jgi:hypothetical protein